MSHFFKGLGATVAIVVLFDLLLMWVETPQTILQNATAEVFGLGLISSFIYAYYKASIDKP